MLFGHTPSFLIIAIAFLRLFNPQICQFIPWNSIVRIAVIRRLKSKEWSNCLSYVFQLLVNIINLTVLIFASVINIPWERSQDSTNIPLEINAPMPAKAFLAQEGVVLIKNSNQNLKKIKPKFNVTAAYKISMVNPFR